MCHGLNEEAASTTGTVQHLLVNELQRYSLLNTNIDIKGKAYEEIVGANLRGDRGEFFTPHDAFLHAERFERCVFAQSIVHQD